LTDYFTQITRNDVKEYFRPNLWPNTPDILTQYLQYGGKPAFMVRLILAATLGSSYGIYGPPFELCEHQPLETGSEEYLDSEKYQLRQWDFEKAGNLSELIARINQARRANPALQSDYSLQFHRVDNEKIIAYSKSTPDGSNLVLTIVNLDPFHIQRGWIELPLEQWGIGPRDNYQFHDLLTDARFLWNGARNYIELDRKFAPAHVLSLKRYGRTERHFGYFL